MQKTATLKNFKVFLFKTILLSMVLSISFTTSFAQEDVTKPTSAKTGLPTKKPAASPTVNNKLAKAQALTTNATITGEALYSDVPEMNESITEKMQGRGNANSIPSVLTGETGRLAPCVFTGSHAAGDAVLAVRLTRDGVSSSCAAAKACPGPFGAGPYFYDTYTIKNIACSSQCVTVSYIASGATGNVFVTAYANSFTPSNLCTNYIADGGLSSVAPGALVSFSVTVPANGTVVLVASQATAAATTAAYTINVSAPLGVYCDGVSPAACVPSTSAVLSQAGGAPVLNPVFSETFNTVVPLPTGWASQNLSSPVGATGWFQGNAAVFGANSGAGYIAANFNNVGGANTISNWLFAPTTTLRNGDRFSFFTRTAPSTFPDRMQVRMSTNGASVNAGATNTSVGDFTTLLLDINPTYTTTGYPTAWTQYNLTLSGLPAAGISGRIAFRYFVENGGAGANSNYIGIDDVVYSNVSETPVVTCTGSTANLRATISGGSAPAYDITIRPSVGADITVLNYVSGNLIPVTPSATTSYTIVNVVAANDPCCVGTGLSGNPTVTVSPTPIAPIAITANPNAPVCAGSPVLLNVSQAPSIQAFSSTTPVLISSGPLTGTLSGPASPYPSTLNVAGLPATGATVSTVSLSNMSHTFASDIDIVLQSPTGQNVILLSDFGGGNDFINANLTFSDAGAIMTSSNPMPSGTFRPVNTAGPDNFVAPGPGSITNINPTLATFTGNPNGQWKLFVVDQFGGDTGRIAGGFSIRFNVPGGPVPAGYTYFWSPSSGISNTTSVPVAASPLQTTTYTVLATVPGGCQTSANLTINVNQLPIITVPPTNVSVCAGQAAVFTASASGAGLTYQWQISTNSGTTWTNLTNAAPYSGVTGTTLTVSPTTSLMNNYRYRMVVSGICPPSEASAAGVLTVKALPVVSFTPASPVCGGIAGTSATQITAGSAPPPVPGSVTVNSGTIAVAIPDNTANGSTDDLTVSGIPANATITGARVTLNLPHTYVGDLVINLRAPNNTILALDKYLTVTGGTGATTGFTNTVISSAGTAALSSGTNPYTGVFRPDAVNGNITGATVQNPTGFVSTATNFAGLYGVPNGVWTLAMADGFNGDVGTLTSWSITIDYTTPGVSASPLTYTWSPAAGLYNNATGTAQYVAGTQTNIVYAAPTTFTTYTITGTDASTGCVNTSQVLVNYLPPNPTVTPASVTMCATDAPVKLSSSTSTTLISNFNKTGINVAIPDNTANGASDTLVVAGLPANAQITGVALTFTMPHTFAGDMVMNLKAPNGNILALNKYLTATGGTGPTIGGYVNTVISSTGTAALSSGTGTYTGTFRADAINGNIGGATVQNPTGFVSNAASYANLYSVANGNWVLAMADGFAGDVGTLTSWSLRITYVVGTPASPATWSPIAGLFNNSAGTIPYTGDQRDSVWTRPTASTTYSVTVNGIGPDVTPTFANTNSIAINDGTGTPYPSNLTVSGVPLTAVGGVKVKSVILNGLSHTWSSDMDILLQSPTGTNVTLLSDVGDIATVSNVTYTMDDAGAAMSLTGGNPTGTYKPTNLGAADTYPAPGPGAVNDATPALANFAGDFNGVWKLFVFDDAAGDVGAIAGGWSITFQYASVGCASGATTVPVTVNVPAAITAQPVNTTVCTDKVTSFSVTATGTGLGHNWQYSTQNGNPNTWINVVNSGVFSGATTATLTITAPPVSMNGWLFRDSVKAAAPCGAATSNSARLTVNGLPVISIAASPYTKLFPGLKTTLTSTVSPAAGTYAWLRNGATVAGATGANVIVDVDGIGEYVLRVTDVNGCVNTSNLVTISDSVSGRVFIYPNPNPGQFQVRYYSVINNSGLPRGINVYDARGKRITTQTYSIAAPYARMDVDLRSHGTGIYWIEVVDANGNRLDMGRVAVQR
jgi:subtilisin-like proprotein convertase family protein